MLFYRCYVYGERIARLILALGKYVDLLFFLGAKDGQICGISLMIDSGNLLAVIGPTYCHLYLRMLWTRIIKNERTPT